MSTNKKIDFVYCFDTNFNYQAFSSMISLLDAVSDKINIHILHNDLETLKNIPFKITNHINLSNLSKYEFKDTNLNFPNLETSHVSQATYYRLFISKYVKVESNFIVYIDADMICISDPIASIKETFSELEKSGQLVAAKTEIEKKLTKEELEAYMKIEFFKIYWPFDRLPIKNKYFNAGFMIINLDLWKENNIYSKLLDCMDEIRNKIVAWDQDILNSVIKDNYLELDSKFNLFSQHYFDNNNAVHFLHYYGSKKPWKTDGVFNDNSEAYHKNFRKVNQATYHIEHTWRLHSLKQLIYNIANLKFFKLQYPISFIKEFTYSLFFKN